MVEKLRLVSQHLSFILLMYGGRLGIELGHALPCFSCPFVSGCAGGCYLMALQRSYVGFQTTFEMMASMAIMEMVWPFIIFLLFFSPPLQALVRLDLPLLPVSRLDHPDPKTTGHP